MPIDAETLKWVTVDDFSPGIYDPRGTVLDSRGPSQSQGAQTGAPLGAAQLLHAIRVVTQAETIPDVFDFSDTAALYFGAAPGPFDAIAFRSVPNIAVATELFDVGSATGAITNTPGSSLARAIIPDDASLATNPWWLCGWANNLTNFGTLIQVDGVTGVTSLSPCFSLSWQPDSPGVTAFIQLSRRIGIATVTTKSISVPVTAGPSFVFASYNPTGDRYKIYVDGVLVLSTTGTGAAAFGVPTNFIIGGGPTAGTKTYDECSIGTGVVADVDVAAVYAARTDLSAYRSAVTNLGTGAYAHYALDSTPGFDIPYSVEESPGTFRCVCAPGKGLVGAPRLIGGGITQSFPIVSSLRSGSTTTNQSNRLADISGNNHFGSYTAANFSRVPGINPSSAAIADTTTLAPTQSPNNPDVATTTFDGDWTVNFWCDDLGAGDAGAHTMLYVWNATAAGSSSFITISRRNDLAGANQFQLIITRRWAAGGGNSQTWTQASVAALAAGYHMLTVKYTLATDVIRILIDGVLIETIAGSGAAGSALSVPIDKVADWLRGAVGTQWDEVSFHPSVLTDPQVATIFAAATSQGAYQAAVMARSPDSYYTFEEDGTHPTGESRALITATHLVSPILRSSATIQPTPPDPAVDAYQDGLFVSFSQFVDPGAGITWANRIDARLYKLWPSPPEIYDLDTGFTLGVISMTPLTRLDGTPWSVPFWHGCADWAEVVTGNGGASPPYFTQVCFLYNAIQSLQTGGPYAQYIMGYPNPNTPALDSIITIALNPVGNFRSPELLFSHEGRLCDIDSFDGDLFGTNAARRGLNDIDYWPIRDTSVGVTYPIVLNRPIEENQSGIRVAQSVNANELFLVKATGGGAVLSGDMDFPTIRRLPGLHSPGDLYAKPINTPIGIVYAGYGGVYLWSGAETSQLLSPQFDGPFWHPYLGAFSQYTPPANRFGFVGGFGWLHPWILAPSHFLFDTRFNSWWLLDNPADGMPSIFQHGTARGHILSVQPEINNIIYADPNLVNASNNSVIANRYDSDLQATDFAWTSQPITPEMFRVAQVREINIQATSISDGDDGTITVTIATLDGSYEQRYVRPNGDGRPHTYRMPFALQTETFIVTLESFCGTVEAVNQAAPIIHSFRIGYELLAEHPMIVTS